MKMLNSMNKPIHSLQDALSYQLQRLLYTEQQFRQELSACLRKVTSREVRQTIETYLDSTRDSAARLDRVYDCLMLDPVPRKDDVIPVIIRENRDVLARINSPHLADFLVVSCAKTIQVYKAGLYQSCYLLAAELGLDGVADLIQQLLEGELAAGRSLTLISVNEFNKMNEPATVG